MGDTTISSYEDYNRAAAGYGGHRVPAGLEIILGCLLTSTDRLSQLSLLDAGCGPGNYSAALQPYLDGVTSIDLSTQMATACRDRVNDPARVVQGTIEELPFKDASFDIVLCAQVLHHLPEAGTWARHSAALSEFHRVLSRSGHLLLSASSQKQLSESVWYFPLIPRAARDLRRRHIPHEDLVPLLGQVGFEYQGKYVPIDHVVQGAAYFDTLGPTKKTWRDSNSVWSLASQRELADAIAVITKHAEAGSLADYAKERDETRKQIGQVTFLHARKTDRQPR